MRGSRPHPLSRFSVSLCLLVVVAAGAGCARSVYRRQADREVYKMIDQKAGRMEASTVGWRLDRAEDSRLFDPQNPDHPPMPADDPAAHELMRTGPRQAGSGDIDPEQRWKTFLPTEDKGATVRLSLRDAVEVAARNSRDFQAAREELYLSALDLS